MIVNKIQKIAKITTKNNLIWEILEYEKRKNGNNFYFKPYQVAIIIYFRDKNKSNFKIELDKAFIYSNNFNFEIEKKTPLYMSINLSKDYPENVGVPNLSEYLLGLLLKEEELLDILQKAITYWFHLEYYKKIDISGDLVDYLKNEGWRRQVNNKN